MIDITKCLLINQDQFNDIVIKLNCNLTINDSSYLATYLFVNLMAYIIIYLIIRIVLTLYFEIRSKSRLF